MSGVCQSLWRQLEVIEAASIELSHQKVTKHQAAQNNDNGPISSPTCPMKAMNGVLESPRRAVSIKTVISINLTYQQKLTTLITIFTMELTV